jgi:hypothetical protein
LVDLKEQDRVLGIEAKHLPVQTRRFKCKLLDLNEDRKRKGAISRLSNYENMIQYYLPRAKQSIQGDTEMEPGQFYADFQSSIPNSALSMEQVKCRYPT